MIFVLHRIIENKHLCSQKERIGLSTRMQPVASEINEVSSFKLKYLNFCVFIFLRFRLCRLQKAKFALGYTALFHEIFTKVLFPYCQYKY